MDVRQVKIEFVIDVPILIFYLIEGVSSVSASVTVRCPTVGMS